MSSSDESYKVNYIVRPTKAAVKQGKKLPLSPKEKLEIIKDVKLLKHWNENQSNYDYESAYGAIEFKYDIGKRWIRVMVFQDDVRKVMWVIRVFAKKDNQISKVDKIGIEAAVTSLKTEIRKFEKEQKNKQAKSNLNLIAGGRENE